MIGRIKKVLKSLVVGDPDPLPPLGQQANAATFSELDNAVDLNDSTPLIAEEHVAPPSGILANCSCALSDCEYCGDRHD